MVLTIGKEIVYLIFYQNVDRSVLRSYSDVVRSRCANKRICTSLGILHLVQFRCEL